MACCEICGIGDDEFSRCHERKVAWPCMNVYQMLIMFVMNLPFTIVGAVLRFNSSGEACAESLLSSSGNFIKLYVIVSAAWTTLGICYFPVLMV